MVAPISGPFTQTEYTWYFEGNVAFSSQHFTRVSYRQKRPYTLPLKFSYSKLWADSRKRNQPGTYTGYDASNSTGASWNSSIHTKALPPTTGDFQGVRNLAINEARSRFSRALGEGAQLSLLLVERKKSMETLTARLYQMGRFVQHLRKFRFRKAFSELLDGQNPHRVRELQKEYSRREARLRRGAKAFANNFLEYRFMWSATVNDIGAAVDVLQGGVPPVVIRARGKSSGLYSPSPYFFVNYTYSGSQDYSYGVTVGATVYVRNPNLWLANQLGFVNPALLLYEATPLSFVANWFFNIEEFLKQWTEFWGLTVVDPFYSVKYACSSSWSVYNHYGWASQPNPITGGNSRVDVSRTIGSLPGVTLRIRKPWRLSAARGLTAASLLAQRLR